MDTITNPDPLLSLRLIFEERDECGRWRFSDCARVRPHETRSFRVERNQRRVRVRTELDAA
jgi:hypothetical protein